MKEPAAMNGIENYMNADFLNSPVIHQLDSQERVQHLCGTWPILSYLLS